jgi:hypothetical protein
MTDNERDALASILAPIILNFILFIGGAVLLSLGTNWYIGCGVASLLLFIKGAK